MLPDALATLTDKDVAGPLVGPSFACHQIMGDIHPQEARRAFEEMAEKGFGKCVMRRPPKGRAITTFSVNDLGRLQYHLDAIVDIARSSNHEEIQMIMSDVEQVFAQVMRRHYEPKIKD